ncbi:hypothetical protein [Actinocorallia longicatena]|uniref:Uncharacterized protein n=1 Tax=Actinocorallia longicatena TaxID=111803 RepID=A0ABP6QG66_9ACTN
MIDNLRRALGRAVTDPNLDLYCLIATALLFTVLGGFGVSDVKTLSSAVLALLALLALSQIRSRNQLTALTARGPENAVELHADFPDAYHLRRARARDFLFIGTAGTRTVQTMRHDLRRILTAGGSVRFLLIDPTDDRLVREASLNQVTPVDADRIRGRVQATLDELTHLRDTTGGTLEIRVSAFVPNIGFNGIDIGARDGAILVQHYEHRPEAEPTPILHLHRRDGHWYDHYVAEALRIWDDGLPWPSSRPAPTPAPAFTDEHGPELDAQLASARRLLVTGVARNTFVHTRYSALERLLTSGCEIRFLLLDPASPAVETAAARYYANRSAESLRQRILHTLRLLEELRENTRGPLSVRLTDHPLAISLLAPDPAPEGPPAPALHLEYYSYRAPSQPKFSLPPASPWTPHFLTEAEALWTTATPV